ncbi:hypothetical protein CMUST_04065 [Corynebacterium mustelae]|uniref:Uncharacterized protein n=1 Tax=Corynebacterium mustelae TaxID=571915 RepID=A0A0G3H262_9CORY|nr:hypothetical protein CMUST_04065 [Corynebacterium mustelae]
MGGWYGKRIPLLIRLNPHKLGLTGVCWHWFIQTVTIANSTLSGMYSMAGIHASASNWSSSQSITRTLGGMCETSASSKASPTRPIYRHLRKNTVPHPEKSSCSEMSPCQKQGLGPKAVRLLGSMEFSGARISLGKKHTWTGLHRSKFPIRFHGTRRAGPRGGTAP